MVLLALCLVVQRCAAAMNGAASAGAVPFHTLTTVREAHGLSASDAARAFPVHLHALVTFYNPNNDIRHADMFIRDSTGGIFIMMPNGMKWPHGAPVAGSEIELDGVTAPGDYAPLVTAPKVKVLGTVQALPPARRVSLTHLLTGVEDSEWVEVEGVVQSVFANGSDMSLEVALQDGVLNAITVRQSGVDYRRFINERVLIRGNAAALFNHDRQLTGFRVMFPNISTVQVEEAGPQDPFRLPVQSIGSLSRFNPKASLSHMVHLRGAVTLQVPGKTVCIQTAEQALCAESADTAPLERGEEVDMAGFAALGGYRPTLVNATVRPTGHRQKLFVPTISAQQALSGNFHNKLVRMKGRLLGYDPTTAEDTVLVASGGTMFPVTLASSGQGRQLANLRSGSELLLEGICLVDLDTQKTSRGDGAAVIKSFRMQLRSAGDLTVLRRPSWWTASHTMYALGLSMFLAIVVTCWVAVLRRRVRQQTGMLRESEERFRHMAEHDALTGLPSRMLLHDRLTVALENMKRSRTKVAVLMLDLDNFKSINDSFGHQAGDHTLRTTAERILSVVRKSDTAARMGGDEFVVLLTDLGHAGEAEAVAQKIMGALSRPILLQGQQVPMSASIGVCHVCEDNADAESLLRSVDAAMYQAKSRGRNCCQVFTKELAALTSRRLQVQVALGQALEKHELEVYYQPLIDFENGAVSGFEALLRWRSGELGTVMPNDFIPLAEESGLIVPIGEFVLQQACRQMAQLEQQMKRGFRLAVNLSPRQLLHPGLVQAVREALLASGRDAKCLTLEITESTLMRDSRANQETLLALRGLGVQLAIDDFGTGFSNLSYLTQFTTDWIKIDRSLIRNCTTDRGSLAVLRAIVAMARGLGMKVVAEGVEMEDQYALLKDEQCDIAQGYLTGRPMDFNAVVALVQPAEVPAEDSWLPNPFEELPTLA